MNEITSAQFKGLKSFFFSECGLSRLENSGSSKIFFSNPPTRSTFFVNKEKANKKWTTTIDFNGVALFNVARGPAASRERLLDLWYTNLKCNAEFVSAPPIR